MRLTDFFRNMFSGTIFVSSENKTDVFSDVKVDYQLSRALYTSIPLEGSQVRYQLGNFCTTPFIDTFAWYIGLPSIKSGSIEYDAEYNGWQKRNRSVIERFIKQVLIDAKHYGWMRVEKTGDKAKIVFHQISRECVKVDQCVKNAEGGYDKFVFEITEKWGDSQTKTLKTLWTLEKDKESWTVSGDVPSGRTSGEGKTGIKTVPIFEQTNKKQIYLNDGIPEIAPAVPFIQRYDATLRKLGRHVDDGLVPRMAFHVKDMRSFIKLSFGVTDADLDAGNVRINAEDLQNVFLDEPTDKVEYLQKADRSQSAMKMLELLYYIIVELTMPEYLYGASLNSTNASVGEQSPVWAKKVQGKQGEFDEFFFWLTDTYLSLLTATAGLVKYRDVAGVEIVWPEVAAKDDVALMSALSSLAGAIDVLLQNNVIGTETAFNAIKQFIPVSGDYNSEQDKAREFQRIKLELENIKERHSQGDVDTGDAINKLLGRKPA